MRLLAIDPGPVESALVCYDVEAKVPVWWEKMPNEQALRSISTTSATKMCVEMIASYGMPVGAEVFETCLWIGRFLQAWPAPKWLRSEPRLIFRRDVKLHLCDSPRAKDANVRQALIDRYGGKEHAIGKKAAPGPLYGMTGDCWAALGVAVTAAET